MCYLSLEAVRFNQNTVENEGGAIKWNYFEPVFVRNVTFKDNYAKVYGNDIAAVAKFLTKMDSLGRRLDD
jgi:hypothetical protein